jgi:hypothetical protein
MSKTFQIEKFRRSKHFKQHGETNENEKIEFKGPQIKENN